MLIESDVTGCAYNVYVSCMHFTLYAVKLPELALAPVRDLNET